MGIGAGVVGPGISTKATGGGGGSGTVTNISVVTTNGFAGTVATSTTTPAITLATTVTGILKGNGTTISAAIAGIDYLAGPLTGDVTTVGEAATLVGTSNVESIIAANPSVVAALVAARLYSSSTQR